jgi:hypothetical protein
MRQAWFAVLAFAGVARCLTAQVDMTNRGVIRGIVLDTLGRPKPNAVVRLQRLSITVSPLRDTTGSFVDIRADTTDADGRFEFTSLGPLQYTIAYFESFFVSGRADSVNLKSAADTAFVEIRSVVRRPVFETPASVRERRLRDLADARAQWDAQRVSSYNLSAEIDCFCFASMEGGATLEFTNDSLVRVRSRRGRHGPDDLPWFKLFSIPSLFKQVEEAIRSRDIIVKAIEYDGVYGFPTRLDTDTAYGFTDGWYRWRVRDFRPSR